MFEVTPRFDRRFLDLPGNARLSDMPYTPPVVDIRSRVALEGARATALAIPDACPAKIAGVLFQDPVQFVFPVFPHAR
jgi:hypothetical protein